MIRSGGPDRLHAGPLNPVEMESAHGAAMDSDLQSIQEARDLAERAWRGWQSLRDFSQAQTDAIVDAMAAAAQQHARRLAELAVRETGYGKPEDKLKKNLFAAQRVHAALRGLRTCGIVGEDREAGIVEIAVPVGVVAAILPSTNPTSTAIYKTLIALKARNSIVISPHPSARRCICETVSVLEEAARAAGAPEGAINCCQHPSLSGTQELMRHRRTAVILATGGSGIVKAAYSSGKPAYGVGPGNVPVFIDRSADLAKAVADVVRGKTFDWGTICSSEQAIVAELDLKSRIVEELRKLHAHFLSPAEAAQLARTLIHPGQFIVNPKCVGKSPQVLGELAGIAVPAEARLLVAELDGIGRAHPLSAEKLSPVLALMFVADRNAGFEACSNLLHFGGLGHTCVIHAQDDAVIREYGLRMPAYRVVVNSPSPWGSIGLSTHLFPAMTLGCGAVGGNITSDNIGPRHLLNLKRIAWENRSPELDPVPGHPERSSSPAPAATAPPPVSLAATPPDPSRIRGLVERILTEKGLNPAVNSQPTHAPAPAAPVPPPAENQASPLDFVCEADVRQAMRQNHKLRIGPKTLITPAARDLGEQEKIFEPVPREVGSQDKKKNDAES